MPAALFALQNAPWPSRHTVAAALAHPVNEGMGCSQCKVVGSVTFHVQLRHNFPSRTRAMSTCQCMHCIRHTCVCVYSELASLINKSPSLNYGSALSPASCGTGAAGRLLQNPGRPAPRIPPGQSPEGEMGLRGLSSRQSPESHRVKPSKLQRFAHILPRACYHFRCHFNVFGLHGKHLTPQSGNNLGSFLSGRSPRKP